MMIKTLLDDSFAKYGDRIAIFDANEKMTYKELDRHCSKVAYMLQSRGLQVGDMVGVVMPKSVDYIVTVTTCLRYGYGAVLLDADYPQDRIDYCLSDAGVKAIIDKDFMKQVRATAGQAKEVNLTPDTPAIAIYTSGSTGKSKGVLHDQESIGLMIDRTNDFHATNPEDVTGLVAPFTFIVGNCEIFRNLCCGASVTIVPRDVLMNPGVLADFIDNYKITTIFMPPKLARIFKQKGKCLRYLSTGSERVTNLYSDEYEISVCYGMSETAAAVLGFMIDKEYDNTPVGKPLKGVNVYLLDENNNICPNGVEGEICATGHFMTGYIGMPEKTAEIKVKNPFYEQDGHEYMIRTGDLGKRLPSGDILFVNRKDWMVKVNGQRVEPGEIEIVIKNVAGVKDAAVKGFEDGNRTYLCAFYVGTDEVTDDDIVAGIVEKLPHYMVPEVFVKLPAMPLNANGKLDRLSLKAPERKNLCVAPETPQEELALSLARTIIKNVDFGVTDDLSCLGMDSMRSMEYSMALQQNGLDINTSCIIKNRNIRQILSAKSSMCWFLDTYDISKKTLVVSSGIVVLRPVLPLYQKMADRYNILIIEPVQDHYEKTLKGMSFDQVIDLYMNLIQENVLDMTSIVGFMGFSFGGELSAALGCKYREMYGGDTRKVIMGDTVAKLENEYVDRDMTEEDLPKEILLGNKEKVESMLVRANMINSFGYGTKYGAYDGPVIFIDAVKGTEEENERHKLANVSVRYKNATVIHMNECTHTDLFRDLSMSDYYLKLIEE